MVIFAIHSLKFWSHNFRFTLFYNLFLFGGGEGGVDILIRAISQYTYLYVISRFMENCVTTFLFKNLILYRIFYLIFLLLTRSDQFYDQKSLNITVFLHFLGLNPKWKILKKHNVHFFQGGVLPFSYKNLNLKVFNAFNFCPNKDISAKTILYVSYIPTLKVK